MLARTVNLKKILVFTNVISVSFDIEHFLLCPMLHCDFLKVVRESSEDKEVVTCSLYHPHPSLKKCSHFISEVIFSKG